MALLLQFNKVVLVLLMILRTVGAHVSDMSFNLVEPGQNVTGKIGAELTARSKIECSSSCVSDALCLGYQYQENRNGPGKCIFIHKGCQGNIQSTSGVDTYKKDLISSLTENGNPPSNWTDDADEFVLMVNSTWPLDRIKSQWVDLGIHTEACMTGPETCGAAGGAISLWVKMIDCLAAYYGIVSPYAPSSGSLIRCHSDKIQLYVFVTDGEFSTSGTKSHWTHVVLNYIGPNDGEGIRMFMDGIQVNRDTSKSGSSDSAGDGRIVVGRQQTSLDEKYASVQVDELIFFDQSLTSVEVQSIYNSV